MNEVKIFSTNRETLKWIWKNLVPKSGQASSVQGELLRAIEKLRSEAQYNGNRNWDESFEILCEYLQTNLIDSTLFNDDIKRQTKNDLDRIRNFITMDCWVNEEDFSKLPYTKDDIYDRLCEGVVEFCRVNKEIIPKDYNPKLLR